MDPRLIGLGVVWYAVFLFSTVCHESAHALVASKLGDQTAAGHGHASLDPIPHIRRSPYGMVIIPLVSFFLNNGAWMIGWASVAYDPQWALRRPKRAALMALAGPTANLLLALAALGALKIGLATGAFDSPGEATLIRLVEPVRDNGFIPALAVGLNVLLLLNTVLLIFNLLPIPPLDGSAVPLMFLPRRMAEGYQHFLWTPACQLAGIVLAWVLFSSISKPLLYLLVKILHPSEMYFYSTAMGGIA